MSRQPIYFDKKTGIRVIETDTLVAIHNYMEEQDTPYPLAPSVRELADILGIKSSCTIHNRIKLMRKHGLLVKQVQGRVRNIGLTKYGVDYAVYVKYGIGDAPKETDKQYKSV